VDNMSINKKIEYEQLVSDILSNPAFKKLYNESHHGISRYEHSIRVSKASYYTAKLFKMQNLESITRASLLHDFYLDKELTNYTAWEKLSVHPTKALQNAKKYYKLNAIECDIISKHMFPRTQAFPRYKESYLVSCMDKCVAVYEMLHFKLELKLGVYLLFVYNMVVFRIQH